MSSTPLAGRVALVTGASRGIGKAIALELARNGAAVAVNYASSAGPAEAAAAEISAMGVKSAAYRADVGDREAVKAMMAGIREALGPVDILVNNAGITRDRTLRRMEDADWDAVVAVNLTGAYNCLKACLGDMVERKWAGWSTSPRSSARWATSARPTTPRRRPGCSA